MDGYVDTKELGLFDDPITYEMASTGQQFVNWLVDNSLPRLVIT